MDDAFISDRMGIARSIARIKVRGQGIDERCDHFHYYDCSWKPISCGFRQRGSRLLSKHDMIMALSSRTESVPFFKSGLSFSPFICSTLELWP